MQNPAKVDVFFTTTETTVTTLLDVLFNPFVTSDTMKL